MTGFQPWVDSIKTDLEIDKPDVIAVDASAGVDLLAAGDDGDHEDHEDQESADHAEEDDDTEDDHSDDHDAADDDDGHETTHGPGMDPHFWMDPVRVAVATDTIRQGFADADPGNADEYADNADAFQKRLQSLHERLQRLVDAASTDVLLVAGHDSLQYVGDRYGVTVESLTNVSPDDRPTPRDIERARRAIQTHGLQYICADPLESQRAADQLVQETAAKEVLPLTAMPGLADEWAQNDWGYVEVMENVNIPTLERALDAV
jgi:ABC-type metal ion transport system, periplasmic component/surface adhesin